jgi:hypothetical protein
MSGTGGAYPALRQPDRLVWRLTGEQYACGDGRRAVRRDVTGAGFATAGAEVEQHRDVTSAGSRDVGVAVELLREAPEVLGVTVVLQKKLDSPIILVHAPLASGGTSSPIQSAQAASDNQRNSAAPGMRRATPTSAEK